MKIVQINTFPYKATGSVMISIHKILLQKGYDSYVVWGRGRNSENNREITIIDNLGVKFHGVYTRITDKTGFASWRATKQLINELERIQPDIIHLHNLHGYYINLKMLFSYIKLHQIKVVWTLHDCWTFTGHCAFFDMIGCEKWKIECNKCEQKHTYPASLICDASRWNWHKKKELFHGLNAVIVTPSEWLRKLVKESFLGEYGLGGIADLPIIKSIVSYTNQFHASSAIMKTAFETYDRGQMLSLSAGLFIPFGILGWIVFPIVNFVLARLLIYIEIQSKIVNSLMYKYMYIWMSILLGLSHCYCIETILFCWSKFIFIYWIILKINDIPVKFGKRHRLIQGG